MRSFIGNTLSAHHVVLNGWLACSCKLTAELAAIKVNAKHLKQDVDDIALKWCASAYLYASIYNGVFAGARKIKAEWSVTWKSFLQVL